MWKVLPYDKPLFLSCIPENGHRIYVTDFVDLWWVHYEGNEFLNQLKKSNDDLEMENENQFLQLGLKMLLHPENLKKMNLNFEDNALNIMMLMSHTFPIYLEMQLSKASRELFFKHITQPLLKTVQDLKSSENRLRSLLIKKDKEIEEYKTEADVRLAMYLKTGVFHDEEHMAKHTMYENHFGTSEVPICLLEKNMNNTGNGVTVKQESVQVHEPTVKTEPDSQLPIKRDLPAPDINTSNGMTSATAKTEIKNETCNIIIPKKKPRKLLKI